MVRFAEKFQPFFLGMACLGDTASLRALSKGVLASFSLLGWKVPGHSFASRVSYLSRCSKTA